MNAQVRQQPEFTPDEATDLILGNYKFSEIQEANDNDETSVKAEVKGEFETFFDIAREMGVTHDKVREVLTHFMEKNPTGTDLDEEYGAGMSGIFNTIEKELPAPAGVDEAVWSDLQETLENGLYIGNAGLERFIALERFMTIIQVYGLGAAEQKAVIAHAKERTILGEGHLDDYPQFETSFREAAAIVKKDGLKGLKNFERALFDN